LDQEEEENAFVPTITDNVPTITPFMFLNKNMEYPVIFYQYLDNESNKSLNKWYEH
jgi:hypothetical protein